MTGTGWNARRNRCRRRCDHGSAAAEVVILTPLLVVLALTLLVAGRLASSSVEVADLARTSVDSAVVASTAFGAQAQATGAARYEMSQEGLDCLPLSMTFDLAEFTAGGMVWLQLRCGVSLVALGIPGFAGSVTLSGQASAAIERYREVG